MNHSLNVGQRIELTNDGPIGRYDGTAADQGTILELTFDDGTPTYRVRFDDGKIENHLYRDECKAV